MDQSFEKDITQFVEVQKSQRLKGLKKYETSLEEANLTTLELLNHAEEEIVDAWNYIQQAKRAHESELIEHYQKGKRVSENLRNSIRNGGSLNNDSILSKF